MQRFKSPEQAQHFLTSHAMIGSVAKSVAGCEWNWQQANQAATSNSSATKVAWARMSRPPILRTCPFLTIAITS
jgi:hypothetical protein